MKSASTIPSAALLLVVGAMLSQTAAAKSQTDNFRQCFCWDKETNDFCGGSDWYNSDACHDWFWQAFGFAIPAFVGLFVLLLFPCVFYISRSCCNCCGGRHRSYGCCCADSSSSHRVPEYTNRAILLSKVLLCVVFGLYIYYAVGGYTSNAKLHTDVKGVIDDLGGQVDDINLLVDKTTQELASLSNASIPAPHVVPSWVVTQALETSAALQDRVSQIHDRLNDIMHAERNQQWGRAEAVYRYPSLPLFVLLLAVIFMACNVRKIMGPLMILMCLTSITVGIVFIPHMMLAQGVVAMCNSYNETVVPVVVGAIESQGGCNSPAMFRGLNATAQNVETEFWFPNPQRVTPSRICSAMRNLCRVKNCSYNTCGGADEGVNGAALPFIQDDMPDAPFNIPALELVVNTPFSGKNTNHESIATCAISSCKHDKDLEADAEVIGLFYEKQYRGLDFIFMEAYPKMYECQAVKSGLQDQIHDDICTGINRRITTVSIVLGVMYLLGFISLPVLIRGMKRFTKMKRNQSVLDATREAIMYADAKANAAPEVQTPLVGPTDATTGYPTEAATGYAALNDDTAAVPAPARRARAASRMGDAAYSQRFYGPAAKHHGSVIEVDGDGQHPAAAPGDVKPL